MVKERIVEIQKLEQHSYIRIMDFIREPLYPDLLVDRKEVQDVPDDVLYFFNTYEPPHCPLQGMYVG